MAFRPLVNTYAGVRQPRRASLSCAHRRGLWTRRISIRNATHRIFTLLPVRLLDAPSPPTDDRVT
jgi:hypothetical protein